jgi:hypothetical protein
MSRDYLNRLTLSPEERERLIDLGAANPLAVLGIRKAAPEAFDRLFGSARSAQIAEQLDALLSDQERAVLERPVTARALGARMEQPPSEPRKD